MNDQRQVRLGLVGYGEIGSTLGAGLRTSGLSDIACYDKYAFDGPYSDLIQRRANQAGVTLVRSQAELAERAELILSVTPGSASLESAAAFAPHLGPSNTFVDVASATPKLKQAVAERVSPSGACIGDASIMGGPPDGHRMAILASGPAATRFRDLMVPWGMSVEPVGDAIGTASGIKIMRSILAKGLEALLVEFMLGAGRYGIDDLVLESFNKFMARSSFADIADRLVTTDAIHARRRSEEAAMSADALSEIGIDPIMTRATAARLRWVADLGMKDHFEGVAPANYKDAIAAIETRMKS
jgi:3-hydroxyisobutyrate dehydrogenase-like beta-hydroxyacid dehydrogenase